MRVRVYRNLHRKCLSVQHYTTGKGWRVADHVDNITLADAEFTVYEHGRQRVLASGKKNVHAFVIGTPVDIETVADGYAYHGVKYNPRKAPLFMLDNGEPIRTARVAHVDTTLGIWALPS